MPVLWYNGIIKEMIDHNGTTRSFFIEVLDVEVFDFVPGQFITLDLPIGEKRLHRWRSYSIASHPVGNNILELCIVKNEEGLGTKYLFGLELGAELKFKQADGGFILPSDLTRPITMVCTGTGVAPFKSMIDHLIYQKIPFKSIHLIFGTRTRAGVLYYDHFKKLEQGYPHFRYDVALSRESIEGFRHGYVHDIYMDEYSDNDSQQIFMLCGWSKMIDEACANLIIKKGYRPDQVKYELYGS
jgi:ferredoxin-NADP reductase